MKFTNKWIVVPYNMLDKVTQSTDISKKILKNKDLSKEEKLAFYNNYIIRKLRPKNYEQKDNDINQDDHILHESFQNEQKIMESENDDEWTDAYSDDEVKMEVSEITVHHPKTPLPSITPNLKRTSLPAKNPIQNQILLPSKTPTSNKPPIPTKTPTSNKTPMSTEIPYQSKTPYTQKEGKRKKDSPQLSKDSKKIISGQGIINKWISFSK